MSGPFTGQIRPLAGRAALPVVPLEPALEYASRPLVRRALGEQGGRLRLLVLDPLGLAPLRGELASSLRHFLGDPPVLVDDLVEVAQLGHELVEAPDRQQHLEGCGPVARVDRDHAVREALLRDPLVLLEHREDARLLLVELAQLLEAGAMSGELLLESRDDTAELVHPAGYHVDLLRGGRDVGREELLALLRRADLRSEALNACVERLFLGREVRHRGRHHEGGDGKSCDCQKPARTHPLPVRC